MLVLLAMAAVPATSQEAAALYKTKCAGCHGAEGAGKPALAGTNLLTPEAKKRPDAEVTAMIAEGGKKAKAAHAFSKKGLTEKQVALLLGYVRQLQKK
jgi:mono/diheme cytochrome c family protein